MLNVMASKWVFLSVLVQGNTCLENGSYLMNYLGCANCHQRDFVLISNKATEDEDGEEIVTYDRQSLCFTLPVVFSELTCFYQPVQIVCVRGRPTCFCFCFFLGPMQVQIFRNQGD